MTHFDGLGETSGNNKTNLNQGLSRQTSSNRSLHMNGVVLADKSVERTLDAVYSEGSTLRAGGGDFLNSSTSNLDKTKVNQIHSFHYQPLSLPLTVK